MPSITQSGLASASNARRFMGNLTLLTAAFDPKQEERNGFSNGDYSKMHVSNFGLPDPLRVPGGSSANRN